MLNDIKKNRALVMGLVEDCPAGKPRQDCIVNYLRQIHFIDAHVIVRKLPESDLQHILNHHENCLAKRCRISGDAGIKSAPSVNQQL